MDGKEEIFKNCYDCLWIYGQLVLAAYLAFKPSETSPEIKEWVAQKPACSTLWSLEQTCTLFSKLDIEVRKTGSFAASVRMQI